MLKISAFASAALLALGVSASAADLPVRKSEPVYVPVAYSWTGAYIGVNAGGIFTHNKVNIFGQGPGTIGAITSGAVPSSVGHNKSGFIGGVQAGYNWQSGAFVMGVEADIDYVSAKARKTVTGVPYNVSNVAVVMVTPGVTVASDLRWLATARLRAGFALDRALLYVTGGLALGDVRNSVAIYRSVSAPASYWGSNSDIRAGWTLGAGVEYAITNNLSVKGEYLYYSLGKKTISVDPVAPVVGANFGAKFKNDGHIVRAGLNWKF